MKKNIIIIVLAILVVMFGLFAFAQKVKADQSAEYHKLAQVIADDAAENMKLAQNSSHRTKRNCCCRTSKGRLASTTTG